MGNILSGPNSTRAALTQALNASRLFRDMAFAALVNPYPYCLFVPLHIFFLEIFDSHSAKSGFLTRTTHRESTFFFILYWRLDIMRFKCFLYASKCLQNAPSRLSKTA